MALIEIDGLPIKNGDFPWRTVSHNQRVRDILGYDNIRQSWTFNNYIYIMGTWVYHTSS